MQRLTQLIGPTHAMMRQCAFEVRMEILALLIGGPCIVSDLAKVTELELPAISAHLKALRREGLITSQTQRNRRIQSLTRLVRSEQHEDAVRVRIEVPGGIPFGLDIPLDVVEGLHPGYTRENREHLPRVTVRSSNARAGA